MTEIREAIARLTPDQRARLEERLRSARQPPSDEIGPRPDLSIDPLSPGQKRVWSLARLRSGDPVYNLQSVHRIQGPLDAAALEWGMGEILQRHAALRARFIEVEGQPEQRITAFDGFEFDRVDLEHLPAIERLEAAERVATREAERPFDLAREPLFRAKLVRLGEADHVLVVTTHHIVCDGWSMERIEHELGLLYRAHVAGLPSPLPVPRIQYADYAHWQLTGADDATTRRNLAYWEAALAGSPQPLRLPVRGRSTPSLEGGHRNVVLAENLTERVKRLSSHARVTPFITLLTGFQILLNRSTGQTDIVLCSPVAGRAHMATEELVGYFNNLVVLRGDLSGDPTVSELLVRSRSVVAGAFDHQETPFQDVARLVKTPLTRGLFVLQETSSNGLDLPEATVTPLVPEASTSDFDLAFFVREVDGRYRVVVRYRQRLFSPEDVDGLVASFEQVLTEMVEWPDRLLAEFRMLSRFEDEADDVESDGSTTQNPRNLLESQLREIWQKGFGSRSIGVDDDFFALGGHSLLAAELLFEVEQQIVGEPLPLSTLFQAPTISLLAKLIETRGWTASWSSLVPIQPAGDRPPLFFVHAHGGNVIGYHDLARHLGPDQPFYGLQAPRTGDSQAQELEEMAAGYLDEIRTVQGSGPYLLGGWCLGGDVAYEMAQQLSKAGEEVALVLMVENPRPEVEPVLAPLPVRLLNRVRTRLTMEWSNVVEIPSSRRTRFLIERMSRLALHFVVRVEVALARILDRSGVSLPHSRAFRQELVAAVHSKAYAQYQPEPYSGPVTLVRAARQPFGQLGDSSLGWSPLVESLQVVEAPGHRIGLLSEPRIGTVANQIRDVIDRALERAGSNGAGR